MAKLRGPQSEFEQFMGECLRSEDPIVARYVAQHEALLVERVELLKRVTVLERALEKIDTLAMEIGPYRVPAFRTIHEHAREALDG